MGGLMEYLQSYFTDIGIKRDTNQDSLALVKAETQFGDALFAIACDGMGGYSHGELASKYCVKSFCRWFKTIFPSVLYTCDNLEIVLRNEWISLVRRMNSTLANYCVREKTKLGCTLTAFLFIDQNYYAVHVGDSRGYVISEHVKQITQDHSVIAEQVRSGEISSDKVAIAKKNILTQSVGVTRTVRPDFYSGHVKHNDCFLICTDGLWHHLTDEELKRYLTGGSIKDNQQLRMHLNFLVEQSKTKGEKDNISCLAVIPREE